MDNCQNLIEYLRKSTVIDQNEAASIAGLFRTQLYKKGASFSKQGELLNKIGFIVSGIFTMQVIKEDGSAHINTFLKDNDFLLSTFDSRQPSSVTIQAVRDSLILEARYSDVQNLFTQYPSLGIFARKETEKVLENTYAKLEQLSTLTAKDRYRIFKSEFSELEEAIPQYLIASYLGITPTQLSRIRKAYQQM